MPKIFSEYINSSRISQSSTSWIGNTQNQNWSIGFEGSIPGVGSYINATVQKSSTYNVRCVKNL